MRLIDADWVLNALTVYGQSYDYMSVGRAAEVIEDAPTIDAEPVRRGRWIYNEEENTHHCSRCNALVEVVSSDEWDYRYWRYCPNCGAKMEENI